MEHLYQPQPLSTGDSSPPYRLFFITNFPLLVKRVPFRAHLVGRTQSNISIPASTARTISSGVPTPIRYLGRFSGSCPTQASVIAHISPFSSPTESPPIA